MTKFVVLFLHFNSFPNQHNAIGWKLNKKKMNNLPELEILTKILNAQIKSLVVLKIIAKNTANDPKFNIDEEISKEYENTALGFTKTFFEVRE